MYTAGTINTVKHIELLKPPTNAQPKPFFQEAPAPVAKATGKRPITIAKVVIKIGRRRSLPAAISASNVFLPSAFSLLAKSTISIEFLLTKPIITTKPIMVKMVKELWDNAKAKNAPMKDIGIAKRTTKG